MHEQTIGEAHPDWPDMLARAIASDPEFAADHAACERLNALGLAAREACIARGDRTAFAPRARYGRTAGASFPHPHLGPF